MNRKKLENCVNKYIRGLIKEKWFNQLDRIYASLKSRISLIHLYQQYITLVLQSHVRFFSNLDKQLVSMFNLFRFTKFIFLYKLVSFRACQDIHNKFKTSNFSKRTLSNKIIVRIYEVQMKLVCYYQEQNRKPSYKLHGTELHFTWKLDFQFLYTTSIMSTDSFNNEFQTNWMHSGNKHKDMKYQINAIRL